jgi:hypothetical protein
MTTIDPNHFRGRLTPKQAHERLIAVRKEPQYKAAIRDPRHADHEAYKAQDQFLSEIIAGMPAPPDSTPAPAPTEQTHGSAPSKRIADIQKSAAYNNKRDPGHAAAVEAMAAAVADAYPAAAAPREDMRGPAVRRKIEELQGDPAWRDKSNPGHVAAIDKMSAAYTELAAAQGTKP